MAGEFEEAMLVALAAAQTHQEKIEIMEQINRFHERPQRRSYASKAGKPKKGFVKAPSRNFTPEEIARRKALANPAPKVSPEEKSLEKAVSFFESQSEEKPNE